MSTQTTKRPKGYAAWNPQQKTRDLLDQVNEVLVEYREHLPLTLRQIFYRLVGRFGYEKTEAAYERLGNKLVRARRACLIPFDAIRDDGLRSEDHLKYGGPADFWDSVAYWGRSYRRDRQADQPVRIELWCEAEGMVQQLAQVAGRYSVPVFTASGFNTLPGVRAIVDRALEQTVPTVVLHVGDHDPSGESIFEAMTEDATAFLERDRQTDEVYLEPVRVALTAEQVERYQLPTAPAKQSDSRSRRWKGETCQLEALAPDEIGRLVETAIRDHLDLDLLDQQIRQEAEDRETILRQAAKVGG